MALKFVAVIVASIQIVSIQSVRFIIRNDLLGPIEVGIQGNPGHPHLNNGGFHLNQGEERAVDAPDNWGGRFWAKTWCVKDGHCQTGNCANRVECAGAGGEPPATLVEIKLRGHGNKDFYDVSVVDGFNAMAKISPQGGQGNCQTVSCKKNLNYDCPDDLKIKNGNDAIACYSSCTKYKTDAYCCTGAFNNEDVCNSNNIPSAGYFKSNCPQYYSYAYDDSTSTFTCHANSYRITFSQ